MKKSILKFTGLVAMAALMMFNVQFFVADNDSLTSLVSIGNLAVAGNENEGETKCQWWQTCNKRVHSIDVICTSVRITRVYFNSNGQVTGNGTVGTFGQVSMNWGYATGNSQDHVGATEPYEATKVNCPTDGKLPFCEPYWPC